ncbi:MAG: nicotinate (nicotinamide) nucleotide adenylyltransferase [Bacteroidales bacterium]|jgi:nicotinate-nucleotide adenylyltransferase|nr:nicotinate (nicotinamide) nucleotide adenylyltransferase [Bacteroidales bacterium]MDD2424949.1 nicotinate (nicotinamide) nucleotide adenylyltransferase [Bacteroidales bacterium]MDD3989101.1 nicotinate (nicotinamide) nucleotide adenylyltransferase [Bacteroidales bacterium]MDD4639652.1 nicotinate (nicotinamide) nucleotide adenylyltransferase [Bacteroidales bacterium]
MMVALYFGSFNPMHTGHMQICRYLSEMSEIGQVRLVVSPQNPLKGDSRYKSVSGRIKEVKKAAKKMGEKVAVSGIEYTLKRPLYTINTIREIKKREPENSFILVIGADNLSIIEKWHQWEELLKELPVWVYPRKGFDGENLCIKYGTRFLDAPMIDISSTEIREGEALGSDMSRFKV